VGLLTLVLVLTLIGAALRLYNLSGQGFGLDEMYTLRYATGLEAQVGEEYEGEVIDAQRFRDWLASHRSLQPMTMIEETYKSEPSHPPLYYLLANLSLAAFGVSEFALRFPSALFGALTIPFMFLLGRRLHSSEAGVLGAAIFTFAPFQIYYSQSARMYSMLCFLAVVSIWLVVELSFRREEGRDWAAWRLWAGWAGVTAVGSYLHYYYVFALAIEFLFVVVRHFRDRIFLKRWFVVLGLGLLPFLPWLALRIFHHTLEGVAWLNGNSGAGSLISAAGDGLLGFVWTDEQRPYKAVWFWTVLLVIGILSVKRQKGLWLLPIWMVLPPAVVVTLDLLLGTQASTVPRYYIVASPALYLLMACGILTIRPPALSKVVAGAGLVYLAVGGYLTAEGTIRTKAEFKQVGLEIARTSNPDDAVIVFSAVPTDSVMLLSYYMDRQKRFGRFLVQNAGEINLDQAMKQIGTGDHVTLVLSYVQKPQAFDPGSVTRRIPDLKFAEMRKYRPYLNVYKFERTSDASVR